MPDSSPSPSEGQCKDTDVDGGRCALLAAHADPHAADLGDAYLTWDATGTAGWHKHHPPPWLIALLWAPRLQPTMPENDDLPDVHEQRT